MSCVLTFAEQIEGQNRYVTNVIREGYHPSSSAFNEAPLTMQLWRSSTSPHISFLCMPYSELSLRAQYVPEMGYV